jgi:hypothetical protein
MCRDEGSTLEDPEEPGQGISYSRDLKRVLDSFEREELLEPQAWTFG